MKRYRVIRRYETHDFVDVEAETPEEAEMKSFNMNFEPGTPDKEFETEIEEIDENGNVIDTVEERRRLT